MEGGKDVAQLLCSNDNRSGPSTCTAPVALGWTWTPLEAFARATAGVALDLVDRVDVSERNVATVHVTGNILARRDK